MHHSISVPLQTQNLPFQQILPTFFGVIKNDSLPRLFGRISPIFMTNFHRFVLFCFYLFIFSSFDSCDRLSWFNQLLNCTLNSCIFLPILIYRHTWSYSGASPQSFTWATCMCICNACRYERVRCLLCSVDTVGRQHAAGVFDHPTYRLVVVRFIFAELSHYHTESIRITRKPPVEYFFQFFERTRPRSLTREFDLL